MERRRQARTPVNINALLIGEKTVPKGCRVMNVSQNGMQLQCDADGRLLTFKDGDSVDVHLSILHRGKQRKLTIPSWVRHVAANSVDVEFHKQDPQLVDLIESYRSSEQHRLEASLGRRDRRVAGGRTAAPAAAQAGSPELHPAPVAEKQNSRPFYTIVLATVFTVCVITGGYVYTASIDGRISAIETLGQRQSAELSELQERVFSASLQEGRYASLNARITALNDAFVNLENRLAGVTPVPRGASTRNADLPVRPATRRPAPAATSGPVDVSTQPGRVTGAMATPSPAEALRPAASGPEPASIETPTASPATTTTTAGGTAAKIGTPVATGSDLERIREDPAATAATTSTVTEAAAASDAPATTDSDPDRTGDETAVPAATAGTAVRTTARIDMPAANGPDMKPGTAATQEQEAPQTADMQAERSGPWVINLISSTDRAYVENFSTSSGAPQHGAVVNSAMVKGREYWRLQITGFESATAARKHAVAVKRELGVKDVWIFRQK